jgi:hypothetical protein
VGEIKRIVVPGQPGQNKLCKTQSQPQKVGHGGLCLCPTTKKALNRRIQVQACLGKKQQDPISKITRAKRAKDMLK